MAAPLDTLRVRDWGRADYLPVFAAMQVFTEQRDSQTWDELWLVEHPPVYTQGVAGKPEHILNPHDIPVIPVNRGGQVTYHGPGQVVIYCLVDVERRKLAVRELVRRIEQAMIAVLAHLGIDAKARSDAPGVYVGEAKIGSIGLRVTQGCTYHGLSFNVDMDLAPFAGINPCGYAGMAVTQLKALCESADMDDVRRLLVETLSAELHYLEIQRCTGAELSESFAEPIRIRLDELQSRSEPV